MKSCSRNLFGQTPCLVFNRSLLVLWANFNLLCFFSALWLVDRGVWQRAGVQSAAVVLQELLPAVQQSRAGLRQTQPERRWGRVWLVFDHMTWTHQTRYRRYLAQSTLHDKVYRLRQLLCARVDIFLMLLQRIMHAPKCGLKVNWTFLSANQERSSNLLLRSAAVCSCSGHTAQKQTGKFLMDSQSPTDSSPANAFRGRQRMRIISFFF